MTTPRTKTRKIEPGNRVGKDIPNGYIPGDDIPIDNNSIVSWGIGDEEFCTSTFGYRLPRSFTVLGGQAGVGKSTLTCYIAAHISTGRAMYGTQTENDMEEVPHGDVLFISSEDTYRGITLPRLVAAGAVTERCMHAEGDHSEPYHLTKTIDTWTKMVEAPTLIVIDPVRDISHGKHNGVSMEGAAAIVRAVDAVIDIFDTYTIVVQHTNKGTEQSLIDGFQEGGWTRKARSALRFEDARFSDNDSAEVIEHGRGLWHGKANYAPQKAKPLPMMIEQFKYNNGKRDILTSKLVPIELSGEPITFAPYEKPFEVANNRSNRSKKAMAANNERNDQAITYLEKGGVFGLDSAVEKYSLIAELISKHGSSERSWRNTLDELVETGALQKASKHRKAVIYLEE